MPVLADLSRRAEPTLSLWKGEPTLNLLQIQSNSYWLPFLYEGTIEDDRQNVGCA